MFGGCDYAANDHVYIRLGFSSVMRTEMGSWYKALDVKSNRITPNDGLDERIYMRFDALDTIVKLRLNLSFPLLGSICDILWDSFAALVLATYFSAGIRQFLLLLSGLEKHQ